ncbi:MAG: biotin--[acetyl-CoA-carboxylase] ligase [Saprospiraceae bacterium]
MEDFRIYDTIDSTNKESHRLLASGQNLHGTAILALHQTEGLGQYGRTWSSQPGNHLAVSIILQPDNMLLQDLSLLSLKTSIAVVRTIHSVAPSLNPMIKWPNDIYIRSLKLAGILIENSISSSKVQHSIIGIGMNVNEADFPPDLPNPVSLFILTGKKYEIFNIAKKLRDEVMKVIAEPVEEWKPQYDQLIYGLRKQNDFEWNGNKVKATILGVNDDGKLTLAINGQEGKSYFSHEIKWLK